MPAGRPSDYSPEVAAAICERITDGQTLREVCRNEVMPHRATVHRWLLAHEEFRDQYARATDIRADAWADEIIDISDDGSNDWMVRNNGEDDETEVANHEHIQRSKLRVDARKWLMAKAAPKKYGERLTQEVTGKDGAPLVPEMPPADGNLSLALLNTIMNALNHSKG